MSSFLKGKIVMCETPFSKITSVVSLFVIILVKSYNSFDNGLPKIFSQLAKMTCSNIRFSLKISQCEVFPGPAQTLLVAFYVELFELEEPQCGCLLKTFKTDQDFKIMRLIARNIAVGSES